MSTYLLAWAVGEFDYIQAITKGTYTHTHIHTCTHTHTHAQTHIRIHTHTHTPTLSLYLSLSLTGGVALRVYCPPGRAKQGTFALDAGVRALDFYDSFFEVSTSTGMG